MTAAGPAPLVVGLVGRIGSGKSTVAGALADRGATVLDADALAHEVLGEPDVCGAIAARFGAGIVREGRVDRQALAAAVFGADRAALEDLESLVHPRVRTRIVAALTRLLSGPGRPDGRRPVVVLDVPLLMQAGWDTLCDRFVLVSCDERVRQGRLAERGWSPAHRVARDAAWERGYRPPPPEKTLRVDAGGDAAYIHEQIGSLWPLLA